MTTMRILNPTATRRVECRSLVPFVATHRIGLLHNHSSDFNRLAALRASRPAPLAIRGLSRWPYHRPIVSRVARFAIGLQTVKFG